ncbi:MAG: RNA polymerase sigma factor [Verrucomicrobiales bacterium]
MSQPANQFPPTHWSLIAAARDGSERDAAAALDALCRAYWQPLYAFARRRGVLQDEAPDCVQEFLSDFIERGDLIRSSPERGRFRSFLMAAFQNFLVSRQRREMAQKRGGKVNFIALDDLAKEEQWQAAAAGTPAEQLFDRRWAEEIMARTLRRVEGDYERAGSGEMFTAMRPALFGEKTEGLAFLAQRFGITPGGVGAAVFRLRGKFRTVLRDEVSQTVAEPQEVDEEIQYLLTLLAQ